MMEKHLWIVRFLAIFNALHLGKCQEVPFVSIEQTFYTVGYGDKLTMNCSVEADPLHTIVFWNKNDSGEVRRLNSGFPGTNGMTLDNPSLIINYATTRDDGIYTCCAVNAVGTGYSKDTRVLIDGGLPLVSVEPVNYNVLFGTFIIVHCTVIAHPKANNIYWQRTKNGEISTITTGTVGTDGITPEDPSLKLNFTTTSDNGIYVCFASNEVGTGQSKEVNLTVYGDVPDINIEHQTYAVDFGDTVIMKCIIIATPEITEIYWEKYAHDIKTTIYAGYAGTFGNTISDPSLIIDKVTLDDSAMYRCCARNIVGTGLSASTKLTVKGGIPKVTVKLPFYNAVYGKKISLHCSVLSIPNATLIYWEKNETGLFTTLNSHTVGTDGISVDNPSLTLLFPTHSDSGTYRCFATNSLGTSSSLTTFLTVTGGIPIVNMEMTTYTTNYGRNVTMKCNVFATPNHSLVYWEKTSDGKTILIKAGMVGIQGVVPDNPSLTIIYATLSDSAMYTCFAKNIVGIGKSPISSNLTVLGHVPKVYSEISNYEAMVGIPVEMSCVVEALPVHTDVFWKRNVNGTVTLIMTGMVGFLGMTLDNPSLTILKPIKSVSGEYTCYSSNIIGTGSGVVITLTVRQFETTVKYNNTQDPIENSTRVSITSSQYPYGEIAVVVTVSVCVLCLFVLLIYVIRRNLQRNRALESTYRYPSYEWAIGNSSYEID